MSEKPHGMPDKSYCLNGVWHLPVNNPAQAPLPDATAPRAAHTDDRKLKAGPEDRQAQRDEAQRDRENRQALAIRFERRETGRGRGGRKMTDDR